MIKLISYSNFHWHLSIKDVKKLIKSYHVLTRYSKISSLEHLNCSFWKHQNYWFEPKAGNTYWRHRKSFVSWGILYVIGMSSTGYILPLLCNKLAYYPSKMIVLFRYEWEFLERLSCFWKFNITKFWISLLATFGDTFQVSWANLHS